ncbi:type I 3-dehydroquinate dehydratase [bacterium]|nr:type I 3-dehydroquinate dehydratase [bacterium]
MEKKINKNRGRIASPIFISSDFGKLEEKIKTAKRKGAEIIELRIDSYPGIKISEVRKLKKILEKRKLPAIFTIRAKEEGGRFYFPEEKKLKLIREGIRLGFEYLDVELTFLEKMKIGLSSLKRNPKTKIILSYHNFKNTLKIGDLRKIKKRMSAFGPDIIKIAVFSQGEETNRAVLRLIREAKKQGENIIGIAMGKKGKEARIKGLSAGNYLDYFAISRKESTAPGQILLSFLKADKSKEIQKLREKIDGIDEKIINLISERKKIASKLGKLKRESGIPILDRKREEAVLRQAKRTARRKKVDPSLAEKILKLLIKDAKKSEK